MVDGCLCHGLGLGETQVDGDTTAPLLIPLLGAPERYAAAHGTEVELNRLASDVGLSRSQDFDAFPFIVIGPEDPIASTHRAVAGRCPLGLALKSPLNCAAVTRPSDHLDLPALSKDPDPRCRREGRMLTHSRPTNRRRAAGLT